MNGIALRVNTITFVTFFSEATRESAGMFHATTKHILTKKSDLLNFVAPRLLTPELTHAIFRIYPQFWPLLEHWRNIGTYDLLRRQDLDFGEAPSIWADFVHFALLMISQHPNYLDEARSIDRFWREYDWLAIDLAHTFPVPWSVPDVTEIEHLCRVTQLWPRGPLYYEHLDYSYSATSSAIRFLQSIPATTRANVRHLRIIENRESVANCASHARGLITFCHENSKLRVECRANLWETVFSSRRRASRCQPWSRSSHGTRNLQARASTG